LALALAPETIERGFYRIHERLSKVTEGNGYLRGVSFSTTDNRPRLQVKFDPDM
jgi:hypothetical protein